MTLDTDAPQAMPFRRLLVVCRGDHSDRATVAMAARLARTWQAGLTAMAVVELPSDIGRLARLSGISRETIAQRILEEHRQTVTALVAEASGGLSVSVTVTSGKPFLEVIHQVLANGHDLVLKTAEILETGAPSLFASTDQHLLRKCPCPVWLRTGGSPEPARSVIAAVDVDDYDTDEPAAQAALNERILETAAHVAAVEGAVLHVLHVWEAMEEATLRRWSRDLKQAEDYTRQIEADHHRALSALIARIRSRLSATVSASLTMRPRLVRGEPRRAIAQDVRALNASILVMGTVARTGVPGFIIGNTAEDILNSVECSVVTVKPPGYISPVAA